jgi:hypothetical protein
MLPAKSKSCATSSTISSPRGRITTMPKATRLTPASTPGQTNLTALEFHALKIEAGKRAEKLRDQLTAGQGQTVDFTCRVTGAVGVGENYEFDTDCKPKLVDVLAVLLDSAGEARRETIANTLEKAYADLTDDQTPAVPEEAATAAAAILDRCTHKTKDPRRGSVTGSLKIEKL